MANGKIINTSDFSGTDFTDYTVFLLQNREIPCNPCLTYLKRLSFFHLDLFPLFERTDADAVPVRFREHIPDALSFG